MAEVPTKRVLLDRKWGIWVRVPQDAPDDPEALLRNPKLRAAYEEIVKAAAFIDEQISDIALEPESGPLVFDERKRAIQKLLREGKFPDGTPLSEHTIQWLQGQLQETKSALAKSVALNLGGLIRQAVESETGKTPGELVATTVGPKAGVVPATIAGVGTEFALDVLNPVNLLLAAAGAGVARGVGTLASKISPKLAGAAGAAVGAAAGAPIVASGIKTIEEARKEPEKYKRSYEYGYGAATALAGALLPVGGYALAKKAKPTAPPSLPKAREVKPLLDIEKVWADIPKSDNPAEIAKDLLNRLAITKQEAPDITAADIAIAYKQHLEPLRALPKTTKINILASAQNSKMLPELAVLLGEHPATAKAVQVAHVLQAIQDQVQSQLNTLTSKIDPIHGLQRSSFVKQLKSLVHALADHLDDDQLLSVDVETYDAIVSKLSSNIARLPYSLRAAIVASAEVPEPQASRLATFFGVDLEQINLWKTVKSNPKGAPLVASPFAPPEVFNAPEELISRLQQVSKPGNTAILWLSADRDDPLVSAGDVVLRIWKQQQGNLEAVLSKLGVSGVNKIVLLHVPKGVAVQHNATRIPYETALRFLSNSEQPNAIKLVQLELKDISTEQVKEIGKTALNSVQALVPEQKVQEPLATTPPSEPPPPTTTLTTGPEPLPSKEEIGGTILVRGGGLLSFADNAYSILHRIRQTVGQKDTAIAEAVNRIERALQLSSQVYYGLSTRVFNHLRRANKLLTAKEEHELYKPIPLYPNDPDSPSVMLYTWLFDRLGLVYKRQYDESGAYYIPDSLDAFKNFIKQLIATRDKEPFAHIIDAVKQLSDKQIEYLYELYRANVVSIGVPKSEALSVMPFGEWQRFPTMALYHLLAAKRYGDARKYAYFLRAMMDLNREYIADEIARTRQIALKTPKEITKTPLYRLFKGLGEIPEVEGGSPEEWFIRYILSEVDDDVHAWVNSPKGQELIQRLINKYADYFVVRHVKGIFAAGYDRPLPLIAQDFNRLFPHVPNLIPATVHGWRIASDIPLFEVNPSRYFNLVVRSISSAYGSRQVFTSGGLVETFKTIAPVLDDEELAYLISVVRGVPSSQSVVSRLLYNIPVSIQQAVRGPWRTLDTAFVASVLSTLPLTQMPEAFLQPLLYPRTLGRGVAYLFRKLLTDKEFRSQLDEFLSIYRMTEDRYAIGRTFILTSAKRLGKRFFNVVFNVEGILNTLESAYSFALLDYTRQRLINNNNDKIGRAMVNWLSTIMQMSPKALQESLLSAAKIHQMSALAQRLNNGLYGPAIWIAEKPKIATGPLRHLFKFINYYTSQLRQLRSYWNQLRIALESGDPHQIAKALLSNVHHWSSQMTLGAALILLMTWLRSGKYGVEELVREMRNDPFSGVADLIAARNGGPFYVVSRLINGDSVARALWQLCWPQFVVYETYQLGKAVAGQAPVTAGERVELTVGRAVPLLNLLLRGSRPGAGVHEIAELAGDPAVSILEGLSGISFLASRNVALEQALNAYYRYQRKRGIVTSVGTSDIAREAYTFSMRRASQLIGSGYIHAGLGEILNFFSGMDDIFNQRVAMHNWEQAQSYFARALGARVSSEDYRRVMTQATDPLAAAVELGDKLRNGILSSLAQYMITELGYPSKEEPLTEEDRIAAEELIKEIGETNAAVLMDYNAALDSVRQMIKALDPIVLLLFATYQSDHPEVIAFRDKVIDTINAVPALRDEYIAEFQAIQKLLQTTATLLMQNRQIHQTTPK